MSIVSPWSSTEVRRDPTHPGRWTADVDDVWVAAMVPLGGLTAAVAARAMTAHLAAEHPDTDGQSLRSLHCLFASPVPAGPTEVEVAVLRAGRSMSQLQATVHAPGEHLGLTALAAFGAPRFGYQFAGITPPDVPGPEDCRSFRDPVPEGVDWDDRRRMRLWESVIEGRGAIGLPPWDRSVRTEATSASWYRFDEPPTGSDGRQDPLVSVVLGDLMLGSIGNRIGYVEKPWFGPSVDLTLHLFGAPRPPWILSHNHARIAADGYASVETALWGQTDDGLELVAHAQQQMFFSFPEGRPPAEDLIL